MTGNRWTNRMQKIVKGCEFYGPSDMGNPAPGMWTVRGPTSAVRHSSENIEHAAFLYLVYVCRDPEAKAEAKKKGTT
jgi:hypothetical protein